MASPSPGHPAFRSRIPARRRPRPHPEEVKRTSHLRQTLRRHAAADRPDEAAAAAADLIGGEDLLATRGTAHQSRHHRATRPHLPAMGTRLPGRAPRRIPGHLVPEGLRRGKDIRLLQDLMATHHRRGTSIRLLTDHPRRATSIRRPTIRVPTDRRLRGMGHLHSSLLRRAMALLHRVTGPPRTAHRHMIGLLIIHPLAIPRSMGIQVILPPTTPHRRGRLHRAMALHPQDIRRMATHHHPEARAALLRPT
mmetsp:Transcript_46914/g.109658  ORF Transcript_46914/g.109658 Transcript_46914/m.109658 type:complete len:251 (-) Transcript_46914:769-1521(-)